MREDLTQYINALRKCAKEHERDMTFTGCVNVSNLCKDTANLLESLGQISDLKEAYQKGYKDGQEALAFHYELCKEEGSIITVPEGATNGDIFIKMFPNLKIYSENNRVYFHLKEKEISKWWNAPYKEKEPTIEQGLSYTDESGLQSAT